MQFCEIRAPLGADQPAPRFISAAIAPSRGMMLVQARYAAPDGVNRDLLKAPPLADVPTAFGGPDDFAGSRSFSFGGAILLPYANRIRGRPLPGSREIETEILGKTVRLPMNWGGKAPGAEQYAMHGLILDQPFEVVSHYDDRLQAQLAAGDFGGRWLSSTTIMAEYRLEVSVLILEVHATNAGSETLPMGIGWHPYFNLPSGRRSQARLHLPAASRLDVNNYDEVLPTGELVPLVGTPYDFSRGQGQPLAALYLDDCFVGLDPAAGMAAATLVDTAAGIGIRVASAAPPVTAFQVYSPPEERFVAIEPQFNWIDPFWKGWAGANTGMVMLAPGETTTYAVRVELFATPIG